MRFHSDGPSIPDSLLEKSDAGRVVFLCGAGVSLPSGMPTFIDLTKGVINFFDPPADSEIMVAFQPWDNKDATANADQSAANVPLDQIFNLLHLEYGKDEVNALVTERLSIRQEGNNFGCKHALIKRISSSQSGVPQIVTTNFDRLFELGENGEHLKRHVPPVFPDLNFGANIEGITYLHGRLVDVVSESHPYVLSSADFGRAYLSEGWATNFIRHLLERYTVVLVGYQAEDPPVKYLLQGLNHDGKYDRSRLYAFDWGLPEDIEAKWRDRGVTAIAYSDHSLLWNSMEAWADRADDLRKWRASIIAKSQQDPKDLAPYERGQVAHVLRTVQGAKLFSEADPIPHPEWVCVMDANIRSAMQSRGYGDDAETFDPKVAYGLDDDLGGIIEGGRKHGIGNHNLLVWGDEDDSPNDFHRVAECFEKVPKRLWYLISWISKSIDSPVLAWWAIRQNRLHPKLLEEIERQVANSEVLHERARHIWNLILEHHRNPCNRQRINDWSALKKRIKVEGWTAGVLREFRRVSTPRLEIKSPFGLEQSRPPCLSWDKVLFNSLGQWDVVFLERHREDLHIPDDLLPQILGILEDQLMVASGLLGDIVTVYFRTPTLYPGREVDGREYIEKTAEALPWFVQLFDRLAATMPKLAQAHATIWPVTDQFFFRKLKLYAFSKVDVFDADHVAEQVLSLDQEIFWDRGVVRELLFLLVDRWGQFSLEGRNKLTDRILTGPDQRSNWSEEEFPRLRDEFAARYAQYLKLQGCEFLFDRSERLTEMIKGISGWNDGWATSVVTKLGSRVGLVRADENPEVILGLPANEIVSRATEEHARDFGSFTEKCPFTGLVKDYPRKALSALTVAGKAGNYPEALWSSMINDLPVDISPRLRRAFLHRVARLPYSVIAELCNTLGRWLEQNLVTILQFNDDLGWAVYDHIVDGIFSGGENVAQSALGETKYTGNIIQRSRRTVDHALNGPVGMCMVALFHVVLGETQEEGARVPDRIKSRIERLFLAPGEGSDHAVAIASRQLNRLMYVDPAWTKEHLIPMLDFEHPAAEPAWNGFLQSGKLPEPLLIEAIKPLLLRLCPWIERVSWGRDLSRVAAEWLGDMRVFHSDEPSGLSGGEMRSVLRAMSDSTRNSFISWLGYVGWRNENGWEQHVIPLINEGWPRERRFLTSTSVIAWFGLLDDAGDHFPAVYEAVKKFLVAVDTDDLLLYQLIDEGGNQKSIAILFPETTLDLLNRVIPQALPRLPYELRGVLAHIVEVKPDLTSDPRYLRLIDLVERS
ncbi:SIR2 family protein [Iodobacter sp. CM08]|uniref:SIR2 family protein n=1 Tax=Iodobacter sp. CM08 TaxID=3085902 RepID=UPI0029817755|nr:SIR2 family protein [Iodobacter sp. CM08]MDW5416713.1 SIR2 family protein [Iodobacter sp. CM08]